MAERDGALGSARSGWRCSAGVACGLVREAVAQPGAGVAHRRPADRQVVAGGGLPRGRYLRRVVHLPGRVLRPMSRDGLVQRRAVLEDGEVQLVAGSGAAGSRRRHTPASLTSTVATAARMSGLRPFVRFLTRFFLAFTACSVAIGAPSGALAAPMLRPVRWCRSYGRGDSVDRYAGQGPERVNCPTVRTPARSGSTTTPSVYARMGRLSRVRPLGLPSSADHGSWP
jgi:hypothetical protein